MYAYYIHMWLICVTKWLSPAIRGKKGGSSELSCGTLSNSTAVKFLLLHSSKLRHFHLCYHPIIHRRHLGADADIVSHWVEIELVHFVCLWGNFWLACTTTQRWHKQTKHKRHHDSWLQNFNIDKRVEVIYTIVLQFVSSGGV